MIKQLQCEFKAASISDSGEFEGYASTFGNVDRQGDMVAPGAFAETIKAGDAWPILYNHYEVVGVNIAAREDDKGLFVRGRIYDTSLGRDVKILMQPLADGRAPIKSLSIGVRIADMKFEGDVRILTKLDMREYSLCAIPANPQARITALKSGEEITERIFEEMLRDAGFSRQDAKTIVAAGYRALQKQRDAVADEAARNVLLAAEIARWRINLEQGA